MQVPVSWLQALSVMQYMATFLGLGPGAIVLLLVLLRTRFWILPVLYWCWWLWDWDGAERGPRHWDWVRNWRIWDHFCDYFPIKVIRTAPLPPGRSYLLTAHPHGVSCLGVFGAFVTGGRGAAGTPRPGWGGGPCPGLRPTLAALAGLFHLPLYREYALAAGLCPVSRRCLERVLSRPNQALLVMVGGAAEALEGTPGTHRVTLRGRTGFVRLALKYGAPLVPVYVFGEQEAFQVPPQTEGSRLRRLQRWLKRFLGFAPLIFWGRGGNPLLPFQRPITVVVGAPLEVPRRPCPSPQEVALFQRLHQQRLLRLFREHRAAAGVPPRRPAQHHVTPKPPRPPKTPLPPPNPPDPPEPQKPPGPPPDAQLSIT